MLRGKGMDEEPATPTIVQEDGLSRDTVRPVRACLPSYLVLRITRGRPEITRSLAACALIQLFG